MGSPSPSRPAPRRGLCAKPTDAHHHGGRTGCCQLSDAEQRPYRCGNGMSQPAAGSGRTGVDAKLRGVNAGGLAVPELLVPWRPFRPPPATRWGGPSMRRYERDGLTSRDRNEWKSTCYGHATPAPISVIVSVVSLCMQVRQQETASRLGHSHPRAARRWDSVDPSDGNRLYYASNVVRSGSVQRRGRRRYRPASRLALAAAKTWARV